MRFLSRIVFSAGCLLLTVFWTLKPIAGQTEKPLCPVIYAGSSGEVELYWFYPGLHGGQIGNIQDEPGSSSSLGTEDRQYTALTRFPVSPPILITGVSTFVANCDKFPGYPGDQYTPIQLSLKRKIPDGGFFDHCRQYVSLDSNAAGDGETVTFDCVVPLIQVHEVWAGVEWLPGFPTAPSIGINTDYWILEQYYCPMDDSTYELKVCQEQYMTGLAFLDWVFSDSERANNGAGDSLYFEVHYASDTDGFFSSSVRLDSVGVDSLYSSFEIASSGFICIRATDCITESYSDYFYVDSNRLPTVVITPPMITGFYGKSPMNSFEFTLENTGLNTLTLGFDYDSFLVSLSNDSLIIAPGESVSMSLELSKVTTPDSVISTAMTISILGESYPIIYHVSVARDDQTYVSNDVISIGARFSVSRPYPNPFNDLVCFDIDCMGQRNIRFEVFNILGQRIFTGPATIDQSGSVKWDPADQAGQKAPSGIYFFDFSESGYHIVRRAVFLK
jgi:hypothetical protein